MAATHQNICSLSLLFCFRILVSHFVFTCCFTRFKALLFFVSICIQICLHIAQTCSNLLKMSQSAILSNFEQFWAESGCSFEQCWAILSWLGVAAFCGEHFTLRKQIEVLYNHIMLRKQIEILYNHIMLRKQIEILYNHIMLRNKLEYFTTTSCWKPLICQRLYIYNNSMFLLWFFRHEVQDEVQLAPRLLTHKVSHIFKMHLGHTTDASRSSSNCSAQDSSLAQLTQMTMCSVSTDSISKTMHSISTDSISKTMDSISIDSIDTIGRKGESCNWLDKTLALPQFTSKHGLIHYNLPRKTTTTNTQIQQWQCAHQHPLSKKIWSAFNFKSQTPTVGSLFWGSRCGPRYLIICQWAIPWVKDKPTICWTTFEHSIAHTQSNLQSHSSKHPYPCHPFRDHTWHNWHKWQAYHDLQRPKKVKKAISSLLHCYNSIPHCRKPLFSSFPGQVNHSGCLSGFCKRSKSSDAITRLPDAKLLIQFRSHWLLSNLWQNRKSMFILSNAKLEECYYLVINKHNKLQSQAHNPYS